MSRVQVIHGDSFETLRTLPAESVHACVTSPPYWGLRDYGIPPTLWPDGSCCCFGLEPTPELYVAHSVLFFREVGRVLRKDGTLWVNLGDSYATGTTAPRSPSKTKGDHVPASWAGRSQPERCGTPEGLKTGDLVGIPWMVAFALQRDGWWLRRDNIWWKPNPMPESVSGWRWERCRVKIKPQVRGTQGSVGNSKRSRDMSNGQYLGSAEYLDCPGCRKCEKHGGLVLRKGAWRCTTAHEYVFQFSKSADYFCDGEAAKEPVSGTANHRGGGVNPKAKMPGKNSRVSQDRDPSHSSDPKQHRSFSAAVVGLVSSRNPRSVWRVPTKPFRGAHFATFPPKLIEPILRAAVPKQCCAECGAPWAPVIERGEPDRAHQRACGGDHNGEYHGTATKDYQLAGAQNASEVKARILAGMVEKRVTRQAPTCRCGGAPVPGVVLDPFFGSGTTGEVAAGLGLDCIGLEIASHYLPLIAERTGTSPEHLGLHA